MKEHTVDIKIVVDREYKFAFNEKEKKKTGKIHWDLGDIYGK